MDRGQTTVFNAGNFIIWTMDFVSRHAHRTSTLYRMELVDVNQTVRLALRVPRRFVWIVLTNRTYFTMEVALHLALLIQRFRQLSVSNAPRTVFNVWTQPHAKYVDRDSWFISRPVMEIAIQFLISLIEKGTHVFYVRQDATHAAIPYAWVVCLVMRRRRINASGNAS